MIAVRFMLLLIYVSGSLRGALRPETIAVFDHYVTLTEDGFAKHQSSGDFLWLDHHSAERSLVWLGESPVLPLRTLDHGAELEVPDGVIQHWLGVAYLEGTALDRVRDVVLNFDDYKNAFKQQVVDSKLNKHDGDQYDVLLRLYKKHVSAVVVNVNETVKYTLIDPSQIYVACRSTRTGEVEHPKKREEYDQERSPEDASGYLWRLNLYWRLEQADNGVYVELEVISLARREGGLMHPSHLLTSFQDFPRELTEGMIDGIKAIFPHRR